MIELTTSSCQPVPGLINVNQKRSEQCAAQNDRVLNWLVGIPEIRTIVLYAYWDSYILNRDYDNGAGDLVRDRLYSVPLDALADLSEADRLQSFGQHLTEAMSRLRAAGKRVLLITSLPAPGFDVPDVLARRLWREGGRPMTITIPSAAYHDYSAPALKILNQACIEASADCIDLSAAFCDDQVCAAVADGEPLFFDANHLSLAGVARLIGALSQEVLAASPADD